MFNGSPLDKRPLWYSNPVGEKTPVVDEWGNETGTGAHHNGYGGELPPGVGAHGSYGKGQGANRRWYYYGESGNAGTPVKEVDGKGQLNYTDGNEPAMAMWGAVEEMVSQVEATWREVWNS